MPSTTSTVPDAELPEVDLSTAAFDALLRSVNGSSTSGDSMDADPTETAPRDEPPAVETDTFRLTRSLDGYVFETDAHRYDGLSEGELHEVVCGHPIRVSDWYFFERIVDDDGPRGSFLRWLEGAGDGSVFERYVRLKPGYVREWGQIRIETSLTADGTRTYTIRHVEDADVPEQSLERYTDPLDAREIVKYDDDGRYRPLKTAPSLPTGWVFTSLGARDCYETVEAIYPATIANWDRERNGDLDVSHWRETVDRQTGIYGLIKTWDRGDGHEHVDWVAETCCADSQCLKRREWEYDDETDLSVKGGDGVFPCREPCSLVISAARQWTKLEAEESRTYEFELTPGEKTQIEAIIDAVADGRVDEIREADVYEGANRYRTRFLRAKRFDADGNLCGVPTDSSDE